MKFVIIYSLIIITWIVLTIIGAIGPAVNVIDHFGLKKCVVAHNNDHISNNKLPMITIDNCEEYGLLISQLDNDKLTSYQTYDVIYFVAIPVKQTKREMSRLFQYLIVDIDVSLKSNYIKQLKANDNTVLYYHVSVGYRNNDDHDWNRLSSGNASRLLDCDLSDWGIHTCRHFPLFELWSCHHQHYLINLRLPYLPVMDTEYRGVSAIKDMTIVEIHQHPTFTIIWLVIKCIFFILSLIILLIHWKQLYNNNNEKFILYLLCCLIFVNVPMELLSLFYDIPWIVVFNDLRYGLLIGFLCFYWTMFINSIYNNNDSNTLHHEWFNFVLITISSVTLFVYEFCERGIQVIMPFYSIWGTNIGKIISYVMILIATLTTMIFIFGLILRIINIIIRIRKDIKQSVQSAKEKLSQLMGFILVTTSVIVLSIFGYIVPMELYLLHWLHDNRHLSLYGALLLGNYGLWNVYVFGIVVLYSKIRSNMKLIDKTSH